ncbi:hypothetical protein RIF29_26204 [Crotalaria pallida]|uniref:Uncharacterized protein n=1 Tax=Crotalaria pallida TaxID=3830 RepID=A0AAN9EPV4_CROPI
MCRKDAKVVRKEWVVKNKATQKEVNHVVESIKVLDQVEKGIISADRVEASELHPAVVEEIGVKHVLQVIEDPIETEMRTVISQNAVPSKNGEWQTVMTRKKAAQMKKDGTGGEKIGDEGVLPKSSNG